MLPSLPSPQQTQIKTEASSTQVDLVPAKPPRKKRKTGSPDDSGSLIHIVHPDTGVETRVRLRGIAEHAIVYGKDLPQNTLPPVHSVWPTRDAFRAALDAHGAAQNPPFAFKATSSNIQPGNERIVYSCSQFNKARPSCSFMIRGKRMNENGLW